MSEKEREAFATTLLDAEVTRMREHAATSVSPCDVAKLIAVTDPTVLEKLRDRLRRGDQPRGVRCIGVGRVLFAFDCPPGVICLVPRSFLVVVDLRTREVTEIEDPYDEGSTGSAMRTESIRLVSDPMPYDSRGDSVTVGGSRIRLLSTDAPRRFSGPAPSSMGGSSMIAAALVATDFEITVEVPNIAFKALTVEERRFDFSGRDDITVTVSGAGTHRIVLFVKDDDANRSFSYKVSTSKRSLTGTAFLDSRGENTLTFAVPVP